MRTRNVAITSWIVDATVALLPVLACFLGGSTQKWEEGIVITVLAICLLVRPPRFSLGVLTNLALLALLVLATVAFFPGRWFFQPEWHAALVNDFGIQLPSTLTPQPWITLGYLVSFAAGLSWLYVVSTQDLGLREVRFQLRLFTSGIVLLAAICIALYLAHTTLAFWHNDQNFGPFPNRNQTGGSFRARRDRDSCVRSGRSSETKKTVDRLDPGAGPDRGSNHFEFFALWSRDAHGGQRILVWHAGVQTAISLATRAWNLSFSSSFTTHGGAAFRRANTREISSSRLRQC